MERPHPGAQLRFTDSDGLRVTAFITDTPPGVVPGQLGGLELRHRQHARVEDRIRQAKASGLANLPCPPVRRERRLAGNHPGRNRSGGLDRLIGFHGHTDLASCEIATFRYRVLHVAARITRGIRKVRWRSDATWRWATAICQAWQRLRAAFPDHPAHPSLPTPRKPGPGKPTDRRRTTRHTHLQQSIPKPGQRQPATTHDSRVQNRI